MSKYATGFKKVCLRCSKDFLGRFNQIYCSKICSHDFRSIKSVNKNLATGTVGAIQELRVSVDLMQKGWEVFRALSPSCSCDLLIQKNNRFLRIEVRTAYELSSGKITIPKNNIRADHLALALPNRLEYRPELPIFES